ncbi:Pr6Pr family membrane protein [Stagnihabitans tardus]|uniref:Integral membrane protein n=1 Tax=Stagnihabitans tardus TaxID=2699202 RepID=A0AAE5BV52_9RHOB|nr:Pr6Pr family membrane protein [Stagnihabitans tardus]NBZ88566.1 hypothetical protein [Stagnihabitans tardus]
MRILSLILALLALAGLVWQFQVNALKPGLAAPGIRLWLMAKHFTHVANALAALMLIRAALGRTEPNLAASAVLATTMTGLVYAHFIAPPEPLPLPHWYPDFLLHRAVPIGMAAWWLAFAPRPPAFRPLLWVTPALAYLPYATARGALTGIWPYKFLNPTVQPLPVILLNLGAVTLAFLAMTLVIQGLSRLVRKPLFLEE